MNCYSSSLSLLLLSNGIITSSINCYSRVLKDFFFNWIIQKWDNLLVVFLRSIGKEAICLTSGSRSLLLDLVGKICMILLFPEVEVTPVEPDANKIDVFYLTWAALDYCCFILNELFPTTVAFRLKMYSKAKVEVGCYYFLGRWELFIVLKSLSHMLLLWTLNCRDIFRLFDFIWFYDNFWHPS